MNWEESHRKAFVRYYAPCGSEGSSGWINGGRITQTINNAKAGSYGFQFAVNTLPYTESSMIETSYTGTCFPEPLPDNVTFTVSIIDGTEFGYLFDPATGEKGLTLSNIHHAAGKVMIYYTADGLEPPSTGGVVKIRATSSDPIFSAQEAEIVVVPAAIIVEFSKDKLAPGETADMFLYMQIKISK